MPQGWPTCRNDRTSSSESLAHIPRNRWPTSIGMGGPHASECLAHFARNPHSAIWIEFDSSSSLGHPGPTNLLTKGFAAAVAASEVFIFVFTEFTSDAVKGMTFRVSGLGPLLAPMLAACPSDALASSAQALSGQSSAQALSGQGLTQVRVDRTGDSSPLAAERLAREMVGSQPSPSPVLGTSVEKTESQIAVRRR